MIKPISLIIFLLLTTNLLGQYRYSKIDAASKKTPKAVSSICDIANYLTHELKKEEEKVRALYVWIAHNIKYDVDQLTTLKTFPSTEEMLEDLLKTRKGICWQYTELFLAMCKAIGIESYRIAGYTKEYDNSISEYNHAWNAVKIGSNYYLLDLTWAAGYMADDKFFQEFTSRYFLVPPKRFLKSHMPFDPIWQLVDNPINNAEFTANDFSKLNRKGAFEFQDSLQSYHAQNKVQQLKASINRTIQLGVTNDLIQDEIDDNYSRMGRYRLNQAIDSLNYGIDNYNLFVTHRNNKFRKPKISDLEIQKLINRAELGIRNADRILKELEAEENDFITRNIKVSLAKMLKNMPIRLSNLERQKRFVAIYLKTWKPIRRFITRIEFLEDPVLKSW